MTRQLWMAPGTEECASLNREVVPKAKKLRVPCPHCKYTAENDGSIMAHIAMAHKDADAMDTLVRLPVDTVVPVASRHKTAMRVAVVPPPDPAAPFDPDGPTAREPVMGFAARMKAAREAKAARLAGALGSTTGLVFHGDHHPIPSATDLPSAWVGREYEAPQPITREAWMLAAVDAVRPWFAENDETIPPVRISIGWPGGRGSKKGVLGQCWVGTTVDDGIPAIFVTPTQKDPVEILETIVHECIHAAGHYHHRAAFQKVAKMFGFANGGQVKTTRAESPDLYARLDRIADILGSFPHSPLRGEGGLLGGDPKGPGVQTTRMLKVSCAEDGYTLRATAKWLKVAVPECPLCSAEMEVEW